MEHPSRAGSLQALQRPDQAQRGHVTATDPHPIGAVGRTQVLNQGLAGFVLKLLQGWSGDANRQGLGLGFQLSGAIAHHPKDNLAHDWGIAPLPNPSLAVWAADGSARGYGEPAPWLHPSGTCRSCRALVAKAPQLIAVLGYLHLAQTTHQGEHILGGQFAIVLPLQGRGFKGAGAGHQQVTQEGDPTV